MSLTELTPEVEKMPTLNGVLLLAPDHGEAENLACSFLGDETGKKRGL